MRNWWDTAMSYQEEDFDPVTAPQVMAEYLNKQMLDLISTADQTMIRYEVKVKEAEAHLSEGSPSTQPSAQPPPPPAASQPAP